MSEKSFIAFSGGVESTTMVSLFGHVATPVFTDTGWEHQKLYDWIDTVEERLEVDVVRVRGKQTLPDYILEQNFYPSPRARFCTRRFKIEPMDRFLRQATPCSVMIGLNSEETDRTGNHGLESGVRYEYQLIRLGMSRQDCIDHLMKIDLLPAFPRYMQRGGCVGCFFKSRHEFAVMALDSPDEADSVAELE